MKQTIWRTAIYAVSCVIIYSTSLGMCRQIDAMAPVSNPDSSLAKDMTNSELLTLLQEFSQNATQSGPLLLQMNAGFNPDSITAMVQTLLKPNEQIMLRNLGKSNANSNDIILYHSQDPYGSFMKKAGDDYPDSMLSNPRFHILDYAHTRIRDISMPFGSFNFNSLQKGKLEIYLGPHLSALRRKHPEKQIFESMSPEELIPYIFAWVKRAFGHSTLWKNMLYHYDPTYQILALSFPPMTVPKVNISFSGNLLPPVSIQENDLFASTGHLKDKLEEYADVNIRSGAMKSVIIVRPKMGFVVRIGKHSFDHTHAFVINMLNRDRIPYQELEFYNKMYTLEFYLAYHTLNHIPGAPKIVGSLEFTTPPNKDKAEFFISEYIPDMLEASKEQNFRLSGDDLAKYYLQMLLQLAGLHQRNIFHHDLKNQNMRASDIASLIDFGFSSLVLLFHDSYSQGPPILFGTYDFWSPEIVAVDPGKNSFHASTDIYGFYLTMVSAVLNKTFSMGSSESQMISLIIQLRKAFQEDYGSANYKQLVSQLKSFHDAMLSEIDFEMELALKDSQITAPRVALLTRIRTILKAPPEARSDAETLFWLDLKTFFPELPRFSDALIASHMVKYNLSPENFQGLNDTKKELIKLLVVSGIKLSKVKDHDLMKIQLSDKWPKNLAAYTGVKSLEDWLLKHISPSGSQPSLPAAMLPENTPLIKVAA